VSYVELHGRAGRVSKTRLDIREQVEQVVRRRLNANGQVLLRTTRFVDDLGADSLELVSLTLALEEAFDIDLDSDVVETLETFADAIEYVEKCLSRPAASGGSMS
jgi:acyl carrier protein